MLRASGGLILGEVVGIICGLAVGLPVGESVGEFVGKTVGDVVGLPVGDAVEYMSWNGSLISLPIRTSQQHKLGYSSRWRCILRLEENWDCCWGRHNIREWWQCP
jgi:hypothetical protein